MNAIIYARQFVLNNKTIDADTQLFACRDFAKSGKYIVKAEFVDDSTTEFALKKMILYIHNNPIDCIIVYKPQVFNNNHALVGLNVDQVFYGKKVISVIASQKLDDYPLMPHNELLELINSKFVSCTKGKFKLELKEAAIPLWKRGKGFFLCERVVKLKCGVRKIKKQD